MVPNYSPTTCDCEFPNRVQPRSLEDASGVIVHKSKAAVSNCGRALFGPGFPRVGSRDGT